MIATRYHLWTGCGLTSQIFRKWELGIQIATTLSSAACTKPAGCSTVSTTPWVRMTGSHRAAARESGETKHPGFTSTFPCRRIWSTPPSDFGRRRRSPWHSSPAQTGTTIWKSGMCSKTANS